MFRLEHRTGFEPVSRQWQRRVLPSGPTMRKEFGISDFAGLRSSLFLRY